LFRLFPLVGPLPTAQTIVELPGIGFIPGSVTTRPTGTFACPIHHVSPVT